MKKQKANKQIIAPDNIVLPGTIKKILNKQAEVITGRGLMTCPLPNAVMTAEDGIAVGEQVEVSLSGSRQYQLVRTLPRRTAFYRGNRRAFGEEILIAANADLVLAVVTADYLLNQAGYPEQALIAAGRAGLELMLCVSKWDTVSEQAQELLIKKTAVYRDLGLPVFAGTPEHIAGELLCAAAGRTTVVVGDRGCGKTVLIQGILGCLNGTENTPGRTSSTHTSILETAEDGTALIDTPGFRDFSLPGVTEEELAAAFPEIVGAAGGCPFRNCTHTHEEGCHVVRAVQAGRIRRERFTVYQRLSGTVSAALPKNDYRHKACTEDFVCKVCGALVSAEGAGTRHRNHCPHCLSSIHVDEEPGDRASLCRGIMEPVSVWVRKGGEWAIIHKCRICGGFGSNRIAADDNPMLLMSIAVKPLSTPPFPLNRLEQVIKS